MGHSFECVSENISFLIQSSNVPFIKEAFLLCKNDVLPGGTKRNMKFIEDKVTFKDDIDQTLRTILCDAQTSGGLLIAINKDDAKEFIKELHDNGFEYANIIGEVIPRANKEIIIN